MRYRHNLRRRGQAPPAVHQVRDARLALTGGCRRRRPFQPPDLAHRKSFGAGPCFWCQLQPAKRGRKGQVRGRSARRTAISTGPVRSWEDGRTHRVCGLVCKSGISLDCSTLGRGSGRHTQKSSSGFRVQGLGIPKRAVLDRGRRVEGSSDGSEHASPLVIDTVILVEDDHVCTLHLLHEKIHHLALHLHLPELCSARISAQPSARASPPADKPEVGGAFCCGSWALSVYSRCPCQESDAGLRISRRHGTSVSVPCGDKGRPSPAHAPDLRCGKQENPPFSWTSCTRERQHTTYHRSARHRPRHFRPIQCGRLQRPIQNVRSEVAHQLVQVLNPFRQRQRMPLSDKSGTDSVQICSFTHEAQDAG